MPQTAFSKSETLRTSDFDPVSVGIFQRQLKYVTLFVLIIFSVLILRLWYLQILNGPGYRARSELNRIRLLDIPPFRGMIMDRNGKVLVDNRPAYNLYVVPEDVQDSEQLAENLCRLVGLNLEKLKQELKKASRGRPFIPVCIKQDISRNELGRIETHRFNLPGVFIKVEPQRNYLQGKLAFHLLGYLGQINETQLKSGNYPENKTGDLIGKGGVESKWQKYLNGTRGGEQVEVDAAGRKIKTISMKPPIPGANVCLTIDQDLQMTAETALAGKKGAIVAMDPNTGEILALASSPSVDPNLFVGGIDKTTWHNISTSKDFPLQNRALSGQYPPASVFKIIVALAGLEEGVIDPEKNIYCKGWFFLGKHRYNCWKRHGHREMDLHNALKQSCDVYFYETGLELGVDIISQYAMKFGLGKQTGLDLGIETEGLVPTKKWKQNRIGVSWQKGETVSMSIGQSYLLVTPIQTVAMISAVFNGGILYKPQITRWINQTGVGKSYEFIPEIRDRLSIAPSHLERVKKALIGVVNEPHGTGAMTRFKTVTVAGKTGTAQVVAQKQDLSEDENEIPVHHRDHAWFVAVAPAKNPEIAIAVIVEHGGHGGSTAAPIAREMIQNYLHIPE